MHTASQYAALYVTPSRTVLKDAIKLIAKYGRRKKMKPKYKRGDVLRGKLNGREIKIRKAGNGNYEYIDLKSRRIFITSFETLERCAVEKVN